MGIRKYVLRVYLVGVVFCLLNMTNLEGREIVYKGEPIDVYTKVGRVTQIIFPEDVANIIKGGLEGALQIQVVKNSIYVLPLCPVLENNSNYMITLA